MHRPMWGAQLSLSQLERERIARRGAKKGRRLASSYRTTSLTPNIAFVRFAPRTRYRAQIFLVQTQRQVLRYPVAADRALFLARVAHPDSSFAGGIRVLARPRSVARNATEQGGPESDARSWAGRGKDVRLGLCVLVRCLLDHPHWDMSLLEYSERRSATLVRNSWATLFHRCRADRNWWETDRAGSS